MQYFKATIANGQTQSNVIEFRGDLLCGIICPAAVDGTIDIDVVHPVTGAALAFKTGVFSASAYVPLADTDTLGVDSVVVVASTSQTAAREFLLVAREQ